MCLSRRHFTALCGAACLLPHHAFSEERPLATLHGALDIEHFKAKQALRISAKQSQTVFSTGKDAFLVDENFEAEMTIADGGLTKSLALISGQVLAAFEPRKNRQSELLLPNATGSIRGTGFFSSVSDAHDFDYLCCCYGAIDISCRANNNTKSLETSYHNAVTITKAGDFGKSPFGVPYQHFDDELVMLENQLGRRPHWQLPNDDMRFLAPHKLPL